MQGNRSLGSSVTKAMGSEWMACSTALGGRRKGNQGEWPMEKDLLNWENRVSK